MTTPNDANAGAASNGNGQAGDAGSGNAGSQGSAGTQQGNGAQGQPQGQQGQPQGSQQGAGDERYGAPENYTMPEGMKQFDEGFRGELAKLGKDLNLSDKGMQQVYALAEARAQTTEKAFKTAHEQNLAQWKQSLSSDKEIGGEQLDANRAVASKGLDHFATPELKNILKESGLDQHPEFLRFFYRVGKAVGEDSFVKGGANQNNSANAGLFTYEKSDHAA